jgi:nucleotide-binding universal stress UspA family protein
MVTFKCDRRDRAGMYRIVLPVDDDVDHAVAQAQYVADLPGSPEALGVTVAHAYRDDADAAGPDLPDEASPGVVAAERTLTDAGIETETSELFVPVAQGIVDLAREIEADLIVMSGRTRSPAGKALFGSVTQSVLLDAPIPVTVVTVE